jgi:hypothetical protein
MERDNVGTSAPHDIEDLASQLVDTARALAEVAGSLTSDTDKAAYLDFRAQAGRLMRTFDDLNNEIAERYGLSSARQRLLTYLLLHEGEVVSGSDLSGVAGISAFARRLRELRADGWGISSMEDSPDLSPGQYVLKQRRPVAKPRSVTMSHPQG